MTEQAVTREIFVGDCALNVESLTITCGDRIRELEPKIFGFLYELAAHADQFCSRADLMEVLWPRVHVIDNALSRCAYQARRALTDVGSKMLQLETRRGRGYRIRLRAISRSRPSSKPLTHGRMMRSASRIAAVWATVLAFLLVDSIPLQPPTVATLPSSVAADYKRAPSPDIRASNSVIPFPATHPQGTALRQFAGPKAVMEPVFAVSRQVTPQRQLVRSVGERLGDEHHSPAAPPPPAAPEAPPPPPAPAPPPPPPAPPPAYNA